MIPVPYERSLAVTHPGLAAEWHPTRNGDVKPADVVAGTARRIWWRCLKGHAWEAVGVSRSRNGSGCPFCANQRVLPGYNDLATTNPRLANEWHPTKNDTVTPEDVLAGSGKKFWWLGKCGHEWEAVASHRLNGSGCPVCAGKRVLPGFNDLATMHPVLAAQWHPTKNRTPSSDVMSGSGKKVWWLGPCGHEWDATVASRVTGSGCPYHAGKRVLPGFNDLATKRPEIANQWHPSRNGNLRPSDVTPGSNRTAWWLGDCGHEWDAKIADRTLNGYGCPYESSNRILTGFNDLATKRPDLAAQWHPSKNGDTTPADVMPNTNRKVWWLGVCGHEWDAAPSDRNQDGHACPFCSGRRVLAGFNDLATKRPDLAAQWHPTKNGRLEPTDVSAGMPKSVWWIGSCGHEWDAPISLRTSTDADCPFHSGRRVLAGFNDLATKNPVLAADWHPTQNGDLRPADVLPSAVRRVWWLGPCGHEWDSTVNERATGSGCPVCAGKRISLGFNDLASRYPDVAREWHPTKNGNLRPTDVTPGANQQTWWLCNHGHEWATTVASRVAGAGCSRCGGRGQSRLELEVAELLRVATGERVEVDVPLRAASRNWRLDIAMPRFDLYIDLDPKFWHADSARDQRKADALRDHHYLRVRHSSLPDLTGVATIAIPDDSLDAVVWAEALRPTVAGLGVEWTDLDTDAVGTALFDAADLWRQTLQGRPKRSAVDVAPHLSAEFIRNETRPGVELAWLPPSAKDKCWWRCQECGHEWSTTVEVRAYLGSGCPVCGRARSGQARSKAEIGASLAELHPEIAAEFVSCVRPGRIPADLRPQSNIGCAWRCPTCETEYNASPAARVRGRACPRCAPAKAGDRRSRRESLRGNSLAEQFPLLAAEFAGLEGRQNRKPSNIPPGSNHRASWRCHDCSHEWSATVASRALGGSGCPACGRQRTAAARSTPFPGSALADLHPEVAGQLDENLTHPGRSAAQLKAGSHDRCRWRCAAGHEWEATVKNRVRGGTGCPVCRRTPTPTPTRDPVRSRPEW